MNKPGVSISGFYNSAKCILIECLSIVLWANVFLLLGEELSRVASILGVDYPTLPHLGNRWAPAGAAIEPSPASGSDEARAILMMSSRMVVEVTPTKVAA
jgi:hypothetical protein